MKELIIFFFFCFRILNLQLGSFINLGIKVLFSSVTKTYFSIKKKLLEISYYEIKCSLCFYFTNYYFYYIFFTLKLL
ncbi:hypothetical protein GLOIN_2v1518203 [Rhizophagus irregularis DAOM 181602=DAOM 197198]|uniref:Uncharacterized protein n=1 Tax=Rhizophagus irregularis (strain DAOM 181602 / DAOM 197198 / MUCL 43194) TaxID=747089 RepID=A0A2P4QS35_RHIID|nr:hypothetical protein GLOIN_2v1518203 [Rhizophagus irregularis DAOM 181602=DAOM 197198]POG80415.1 hypothetical protein GLOIN_2v1518203 [Rhizophagus irregularis DAOM 181602=DAOM 197198]|eukprot:XP_025187281.1 hypothetical protein GLOIN_2v1518203 [Rhizophagus irregularis DAOM 181602=DAOM 197198]